MTRTGKIARLPRHIRDQLNRRLQDGDSGRALIEWLNSLPEVQSLLLRDFNARPINEPNLTDWKQGGYREWLAQQDALDLAGTLAANAGELNTVAPALISDHLATALASRYAAELTAFNETEPDDARAKLRALRDLSFGIAQLQRGAFIAERVKIQQARLERDREKSEQDILAYFLRWLEYPTVRDCLCDQSLTPDQRTDHLRKLFTEDPPQSPSIIPPLDHAVHPPQPNG